MPKKGKKDGGKTEEERLVLLQQRAQAEEEMAKKKEETLTLFLKDKLQKEQRNTAVNLLKLEDGWRTILRQTRNTELRKDLTVLRQTFGRQLDDLDSVIKKMVCDLEEAELQAVQVQQTHLQHVDSLRAQQDKRLESLQQQWESCLQDLGSMFTDERKQMLALSQHQRVKLHNQKLFTEQQNKDDTLIVQTLYEEKLALHVSSLEEGMADLKTIEQNEHSTYQDQEALQQNIQRAEQLEKTESEIQKKIDVYLKKNKKLQDNTLQLRDRLSSSTAGQNSMENDLTAAKKQVNRKCQELRDQLTRARTAARKQLIELSVKSDTTAKKLQAVIGKGEKILRVAEMCCKLERQQERVLSSSSPSSPHIEKQNRNTDATVSEFLELQQLMQRLNAALQQREALKKHKEIVSRENEQLQLLLLHHQDSLDGHGAPLAVIRAPTTTTTSVPPFATNQRHTVVEAVHTIKHSL